MSSDMRFVTRELTVQELIYFLRAQKTDYEATVMFVESRRVDQTWNLRDMPISEFAKLIEEAVKNVQFSTGYTQFDIEQIVKDADKEVKEHTAGD